MSLCEGRHVSLLHLGDAGNNYRVDVQWPPELSRSLPTIILPCLPGNNMMLSTSSTGFVLLSSATAMAWMRKAAT